MSVRDVSFVLQMALFCCVFSTLYAGICGPTAKDAVKDTEGLKRIIDSVNNAIKGGLSNRADFYNDIAAGEYRDDLADVRFTKAKLDADIDPNTYFTYVCWTKDGTDIKYAVVAKPEETGVIAPISISASVTAERKNLKIPCNVRIGFTVQLDPVKKKLRPSNAEETLAVEPTVNVMLNLPDTLPAACEPLKADPKKAKDSTTVRSIVIRAARRSLAYLFHVQSAEMTKVFENVLHLTKP